MWDHLWINARLATMREGAGPYGAIEDAALASKDGCIAFAGSRCDLPGEPKALARELHDAQHRWITPGLIDCHTHLVFAGNRADEFEKRLNGARATAQQVDRRQQTLKRRASTLAKELEENQARWQDINERLENFEQSMASRH
jgi:imidazolonepropionase-like amidohydrolase